MNINKNILCIYDNVKSFLKGIDLLKQNNIQIDNIYSPIYLSELDNFPSPSKWLFKKNYLSLIALISGIIGLILSLYMMWYMNIYSWKINLGGKPNFSLIENLPSFILVAFEFTVLFASIGLIYYFIPLCIGKTKEKNIINPALQDKFIIEIRKIPEEKLQEVEHILKHTEGVSYLFCS